MKLGIIQNKKRIPLFGIALMFISSSFSTTSHAATTFATVTNAVTATTPSARSTIVTKSSPLKVAKDDYFISADTVIIGCTSGMAAGILVGSVPVAGAIMSGIGLPESVNLLINMTGMGCGVGAVSGAVAILTAWMLQPD